jgi:hypothetical protein
MKELRSIVDSRVQREVMQIFYVSGGGRERGIEGVAEVPRLRLEAGLGLRKRDCGTGVDVSVVAWMEALHRNWNRAYGRRHVGRHQLEVVKAPKASGGIDQGGRVGVGDAGQRTVSTERVVRA